MLVCLYFLNFFTHLRSYNLRSQNKMTYCFSNPKTYHRVLGNNNNHF